jgi:hypothetical protein
VCFIGKSLFLAEFLKRIACLIEKKLLLNQILNNVEASNQDRGINLRRRFAGNERSYKGGSAHSAV